MKKILVALFVVSAMFSANYSFAAVPIVPAGTGQGGIPIVPAKTGTDTKLKNPINVDTFDQLVQKVLEAAVRVLMPVVVIMFIYSGFLFVKAQGNPEEITKAKTAITYSFIGAVILLGAYGFAQIIGTTVVNITGR